MTAKYSASMEREDVRFVNKITPAMRERLVLVMEECAEVQQVIGKILRHGYESWHPDDPTRLTNRELLEKEMGDLYAVLAMMIRAEDVLGGNIADHQQAKAHNVKKYLHFQDE